MKIPRTIIQSSFFKQPEYIIEKLKHNTNNYNYIHFDHYDILKLIKENNIIDLSNASILFNTLSFDLKYKFGAFYYLFLHGGIYINTNSIINCDISDYINDNIEIFAVESIVNKNSIFSGFIGCTPNNNKILNILKHIYHNKSITDYELYNLITSYNINKNNILFLNEKIIDNCKAETFIDSKSSLTHYYNLQNNVIPSLKTIPNRIYHDKIKIGITYYVPENKSVLFINGVRQNALYLCELLLNIGYDCYLIIDKKDGYDKSLFYDSRFKTILDTNILLENFDIVIMLGQKLDRDTIKLLRYMKTKYIGYFCGNDYNMDMENILFKQYGFRGFSYSTPENPIIYDKIFSIPQMVKQNLYYWKTLFRCECIEVPFIWSSKAIELCNNDVTSLMYKKRDIQKTLTTFEPNISVMKWFLPSVLVCENAYRNNKNIKNIIIQNILTQGPKELINIDAINRIKNHLDVAYNGILKFENKKNITLNYMRDVADIVVCHQWENPLNYLYLELAWMGWPVIHNAHLCKDIGYYYEDFNYMQGGAVLSDVINNHDDNAEQYLQKNRTIIDRYLPSNKKLQEKYKKIIEDLFIDKK